MIHNNLQLARSTPNFEASCYNLFFRVVVVGDSGVVSSYDPPLKSGDVQVMVMVSCHYIS